MNHIWKQIAMTNYSSNMNFSLKISTVIFTSFHFVEFLRAEHFIEALFTNADHCVYQSVVPTVKLYLRKESLLFCCNEIGFSEKDILKLCDISDTIGFKSVFKVTDSPCIVSGQFSWKFERQRGIGM